MALLPIHVAVRGDCGAVGFVDDNEFGAMHLELMSIPIALDEVDACDLERIMPVDAFSAGFSAFQLAHRAGSDDDGLEIGLRCKLLLPLVAQIRRAEDAK